jgi:hypothetical protein
MKCAIVAVKDLFGDWKNLYIGDNIAEAKNVYRAELSKKKEDQEWCEIYLHRAPESRRINKKGWVAKATGEAPKKRRRKKASEAE